VKIDKITVSLTPAEFDILKHAVGYSIASLSARRAFGDQDVQREIEAVERKLQPMRVTIDGEEFLVDSKGNIMACPECSGPVVFDSGLFHCDANDHGAFDVWNLARTPLSEISLEV